MLPEPNSFEDHLIGSGWDALAAEEEYEAGYQARFTDGSEFITATRAWRSGWQEADREIAQTRSSGLPTNTSAAEWSLFGSGRDARICGLPFDTRRDHVWKRSWIKADLELAVKNAPSM